MEVISIERSTYEVIGYVASLVEELLTSFNSFVSQMMAMGSTSFCLIFRSQIITISLQLRQVLGYDLAT